MLTAEKKLKSAKFFSGFRASLFRMFGNSEIREFGFSEGPIFCRSKADRKRPCWQQIGWKSSQMGYEGHSYRWHDWLIDPISFICTCQIIASPTPFPSLTLFTFHFSGEMPSAARVLRKWKSDAGVRAFSGDISAQQLAWFPCGKSYYLNSHDCWRTECWVMACRVLTAEQLKNQQARASFWDFALDLHTSLVLFV